MMPSTMNLFTLVLGLEKPWKCTKVEFAKEAGRLDIWRDFACGSRFSCPECEAKDCAVHDTKEKESRYIKISDLPHAFRDGIRRALPQAEITYDRFHVMQLARVAVDTIRHGEQRTVKELKKSRYLWLKNPSSLKSDEAARLQSLSKTNLKTVHAYHLRMSLRELWDQAVDTAESYLTRWYNWAIQSRLSPMVEFARTVRRYMLVCLQHNVHRRTSEILEAN